MPTTPVASAESGTATVTAGPGVLDVRGLVTALADDGLEGRDNDTAGSATAQQLILDELTAFAEPAFPALAGRAGYTQPIDGGTNLLGIIPGDDRADEYLLIGAHYDHVGPGRCGPNPDDPGDTICNGATDNAAGVAAVLSIGRSIAAADPLRRSVVLALWDREEDGLLGSRAYRASPPVPLADTVAYVNLDIMGAALLPSLANTTIMVGAETGGPTLIDAAASAAAASPLDAVRLSLAFSEGRSDHATFAAADIPVVFLTDATNGCYHTAADELDVVDFGKLDLQIAAATALSRDLADADPAPVFDVSAPDATYGDAVALLGIARTGAAEMAELVPDERDAVAGAIAALQAIVDAGEGAFGPDSLAPLAFAARALVDAITQVSCSELSPPFTTPGSGRGEPDDAVRAPDGDGPVAAAPSFTG